MSTDSAARRYPGHGSMWFFVLGDLWIFTSYFACYIYARGHDHEGFLEGQRLLSQGTGVLNTIVLLTSSLFVALCVQATRAGDVTAARRFLTGGGALGGAFMLLKLGEWYVKLRAGLPPSTHDFFTYYFMFTGLHLVHLSLGLLILALIARELRGTKPARVDFVESGATYWHMVDTLWLAIFGLLYLMR